MVLLLKAWVASAAADFTQFFMLLFIQSNHHYGLTNDTLDF